MSCCRSIYYYPFGMEMEGPWELSVSSPENKYSYNGKEMQDDFGLDLLDYGLRWYNPATGRWGQVDPLADKFASMSPYNYSFDNPVRFNDPDGAAPEDAVEDCCPGMEVKFRVNATGATKEAEDYAFERGAKEMAIGVAIGATLATPGPEDVVLGGAVLRWLGGLLKGKKAVKTADAASDASKTVENVLDGAREGKKTKGKTKQFEKEGDMNTANKDFDDLNPKDVKDIKSGRTGELEDGRKVNVRNKSTDGRPTLEIQDGKKKTKIRYDKPKED